MYLYEPFRVCPEGDRKYVRRLTGGITDEKGVLKWPELLFLY